MKCVMNIQILKFSPIFVYEQKSTHEYIHIQSQIEIWNIFVAKFNIHHAGNAGQSGYARHPGHACHADHTEH